MPIQKKLKNVSIALLISDHTSFALALLIKDIFVRANKFAGSYFFVPVFVSCRGGTVRQGDVTLTTIRWDMSQEVVVVPPFNSDFDFSLTFFSKEIEQIKRAHQKKIKICSVCHGAFLLAAAEILDDREATTHWRAFAMAKEQFPRVRWALNKMICDTGTIITSAGYSSAIDLVLYFVEKYHSKKLAHELGQHLLAGSIRQKQSLYARNLVITQKSEDSFYKLESWIDKNIHRSLSVDEMAQESNMSLRNFHRQFKTAFGLPPNKYIQLKRIEKAKDLLLQKNLSIDEIVEKIGLFDQSSFRKIFLRELGVSPAEFRRRSMMVGR